MKLDRSKKIPFGKHQGKTVGWLLDNDKGYCNWVTKEELWKKWDLYQGLDTKKKESKASKAPVSGKGPVKETINYDHNDPPPWDDFEPEKPSEPFIKDNGEVLVSIKVTPVPDKDNRWIEDVKILLETIHKQKETASHIKQQIEELLYLPV
jgi:hypothetical protein